jgi:formylglycine-generating enzyme
MAHRISSVRRISVLARIAFTISCAHAGPGEATSPASGSPSDGPVALATMTNGVGIVLVEIPGGSFVMGSRDAPEAEPVHHVEVSGFWIATRETTHAQFARFIAATGYVTTAENGSGAKIWTTKGWEVSPTANFKTVFPEGERPVTAVSWDDAVAFTRWLTETETPSDKLKALGKDLVYRLPTEAEWEYAARAQATTRYAGTDSDGDLCSFANVPDRSAKSAGLGRPTFDCDDGFGIGPAPAGSRRANRWGIYDMTGNVYDWVLDRFGPYSAAPVKDPRGPHEGNERVMRGGSWSGDLAMLQASARAHFEPSLCGGAIGFRVALGAR